MVHQVILEAFLDLLYTCFRLIPQLSVSSEEEEDIMNDMFNDLLLKNISNDMREKSSSVANSQASSNSSSSRESPW